MRPYMLWLTRVYAGRLTGNGWGQQVTSNLIEAWLDHSTEQRYLIETYPR